jgi:flagellin
MADISLSKAVRSNLLSLKGTADMMASTQNRLATGNKVNSALDNPSSWFTAQGLNNRASDLGALLDNMANGVQTLEAADNGLTAMTKTLESMQSTLRQARQDKSFQTSSFELEKVNANDPALGKLNFSGGSVTNTVGVDLIKTGSGESNATTAAYVAPAAAGKASLASGSGSNWATADSHGAAAFSITLGGKSMNVSIADDATDTRTETQFVAAVQAAIDQNADFAGKVNFTATATGKFKLETVGNQDGTIGLGASPSADAIKLFGNPADSTAANRPTAVDGSDGKHELTINGKKVTLDTTSTGSTAGNNLANAIKSINTQLGADSKFEAFDAFGGKMGIRATASDAGPLTIEGADKGLFASTATQSTTMKFARSVDELVTAINDSTALDGKVRASNDNGKLRIENQSTKALDVEGLTTGKITGGTGKSDIKGNSVRSGLADQFNELRDQLDKLADDAAFNGINLLRGDKLSITFNETGTSSIDIQTKDNKTINSSNLGVSTTLKASDLDNDTSIDAQLGKLKSALNDVRAQASSFGSNLSIVQNRQSFTKSMIDTLQSGAGNLTLADMNEEAANLLALQTRQSLSQNSLSLASQADQSVLQLIR